MYFIHVLLFILSCRKYRICFIMLVLACALTELQILIFPLVDDYSHSISRVIVETVHTGS